MLTQSESLCTERSFVVERASGLLHQLVYEAEPVAVYTVGRQTDHNIAHLHI